MNSFERIPVVPERGPEQTKCTSGFERTSPGLALSKEREPREINYVLLSDIHDDTISAKGSLLERGIIAKDSEDWHPDVHDTHLVLTGDLIDRRSAHHHVIRLFRHLSERAKNGNRVTLLLGNHELDLLMALPHGPPEEAPSRKDLAFLGTGKMVYKQGSVLFLHAYPTRSMLDEMVRQYEEHKGDVPNDRWRVNERFARAFALLPHTPAESIRIFEELHALTKAPRPQEHGHGPEESTEISLLLERLHVKVVVHGHKKRASGKQLVEKDIPGVCMINNDTAVAITKNPGREHRIGSTMVRADGNMVDVTCINGNDALRPERVHTIHRRLH